MNRGCGHAERGKSERHEKAFFWGRRHAGGHDVQRKYYNLQSIPGWGNACLAGAFWTVQDGQGERETGERSIPIVTVIKVNIEGEMHVRGMENMAKGQ